MFKTPWFDRSVIRSDEGFSLRWGRDWVVYSEGSRNLTLTVDVGGNGISLFVGSVTRWDDDPTNLIGQDTQARIVRNVSRAFEWKGYRVDLYP